MSIRLIGGDCREVLATLPADSVHCVLTSPPYYGLRDYGTARWAGGDAACDHTDASYGKGRGSGVWFDGGKPRELEGGRPQPGRSCARCGATRVDRQIGLEPTPDAYLAEMVRVFREVKRVLRPDGVCFVNMGDSYASGGTSPNQSRQPLRVLACDSGGTEPAGSSALGSGCPDLCGECRGSLLSHSVHRIDLLEAVLRRENADGHQPSDVPRVAPVSTMRRSSQQPQVLNSVASSQGARCLLCARSLAADAPASARMVGCNPGSEESGSASDSRDMDALGLASKSYTTASHRYKPKDLLMMPARLALALQADGWWLRSDIIWHKPNPMPESVTDRPTSAHEHVFLLAKAARYYFDNDAVREPQTEGTLERFGNGGAPRKPGIKQGGSDRKTASFDALTPDAILPNGRNCRNVWTIATAPFSNWTETSRQVRVERDAAVDGKKRKASPDCPVHGDRVDPVASVLDDGHADGSLNRTGRNGGDLAQAPAPGSVPTDPRHGLTIEPQSSGSLPLWRLSAATPHSSQSHRTDHAPATNQPCIVSGETGAGTERTLATPAPIGSVDRMPESNNGLDGSGDHPSAQTDDHSADIASCCCEWYIEKTEKSSHFATFPPALAERCIRAGTKPGDTVLDPFAGAGTTLLVADRLQRDAIGIELNPDYTRMAMDRCRDDAPLFAEPSPPPAEPPEEPRIRDLFA